MNDTKFAQNHPAKPLEDIVHGLIYIYVLMIPFQTLGLRFMELEFGPPELVFLVLAPLAIIHIMHSEKKFWIDKLDFFVLNRFSSRGVGSTNPENFV